MKNVATTVLVMVLMSTIAYSQTFKVTGGVNVMTLKTTFESPTGNIPTDPTDPTDESDLPVRLAHTNNRNVNGESSLVTSKNTNNETGFFLGLALSDITLFNNFNLQPEIRFVVVKDFNQIQVPVLLKYGITEKLHASAGPNLAFLLDTGDGVKSFNFALDFGVSYDISDKVSLDARYDWGLTNLLKDGDSNNYLKINNIQLGVVYHFGK